MHSPSRYCPRVSSEPPRPNRGRDLLPSVSSIFQVCKKHRSSLFVSSVSPAVDASSNPLVGSSEDSGAVIREYNTKRTIQTWGEWLYIIPRGISSKNGKLTFGLVSSLRDPVCLILVREPLLLPAQVRRVATVIRVELSSIQLEDAIAYVLEERSVVGHGEQGHLPTIPDQVR